MKFNFFTRIEQNIKNIFYGTSIGNYEKISSCLPENSNFEDYCYKYKLHSDIVGSFDCPPGKKRTTCNKKKNISKPRFGDTKQRSCGYYCNKNQ